ncbi:hypothetical protein Pmani_025204 [Petrolisthes manimaculis]|uniref:Reverse transcriptase/retrotransposon-derived protein RNase H-like domain-containing protein n=1 Tax=Petrolisthes manimaculis TaxID=1843537 RepID=A0AAE1U1D9_9EUCA|nr:hypothetical protein Pmani_025204 [Petrolisthes manimaculis]
MVDSWSRGGGKFVRPSPDSYFSRQVGPAHKEGPKIISLYHNIWALPFGLTNAPSTFQRMINSVVVVADSWEEHLSRLNDLFQRLRDAGLTIHLRKSVFGRGTVTYLGHVVGGGSFRPKEANSRAILAFPIPRTRKEVMRFLGMVGYYRRFCVNFATIAAPLTQLTSPKAPFKWTVACEESFNKLKTFLTSKPVLKTPDFDQPFNLQVDASGVGVGAVLLQPTVTSFILHPVAFFSAKLKPHQAKK